MLYLKECCIGSTYCIDTDTCIIYFIQGSGKTYTIGDGISSFTDDEYGIIPRALKAIFDNMEVIIDILIKLI